MHVQPHVGLKTPCRPIGDARAGRVNRPDSRKDAQLPGRSLARSWPLCRRRIPPAAVVSRRARGRFFVAVAPSQLRRPSVGTSILVGA